MIGLSSQELELELKWFQELELELNRNDCSWKNRNTPSESEYIAGLQSSTQTAINANATKVTNTGYYYSSPIGCAQKQEPKELWNQPSMPSWSYESDEVDNSSFDTLVLYARTLSCFHPASPPSHVLSKKSRIPSTAMQPDQLRFKGLSLRRLEDIQRLTDSEQSLKSCRATCSFPSRKWQYCQFTCKSSAKTCAERPKPCTNATRSAV